MSSSLRQDRRCRTTSAIVSAALELFAARGYAAVTVSEVAAAAGVGERTLYRYFADKEELLFAEDEELRQALRDGIEQQPAGRAPFAMLRGASIGVAQILQDQQEEVRRRALIVAGTPALAAREQAKHAAWVGVLAEALGSRGVDTAEAALLGRLAVACYDEAMSRWRSGGSPHRTLTAEVDLIFNRLGELV